MRLYTLGLFIVMTMFLSGTVQGQNPLQKNAVDFKVLFLDYSGHITGDYGDLTGYTTGVQMGYTRNIWDFLNLNVPLRFAVANFDNRSEEHTSELQSRGHLVCR